MSRAAQTLLLALVAANGCGAPRAAGTASAAPEPASSVDSEASSASPSASEPSPSADTTGSASASPEAEPPEEPLPRRVAIYGSSCVMVTELIRFPAQSARIAADNDATFDALRELFTTYPELVLELRGHADPWERNPKTLARQRAQNVRAALLGRGAPEAGLVVSSCGNELPIVARGKPDNRRVDFVIRSGLGDASGCGARPDVCHDVAK